MLHRPRLPIAALAAVMMCMGASAQTPAQRLQGGGDDRLAIATGPTTGVYFHVGKFLCELLTTAPAASPGCSARVTTGSVANVELLRKGEVPLALIQSDVERAARASEAAGGTLRVVATLHAELLTLVTRAEEAGADVEAFRTRRLGAAPAGSGERAAAERVLEALEWSGDERGRLASIPRPLAARALCEKRVDGLLLMLGHPNNFTIDLGQACPIRFVPLAVAGIEKAAARLPDFSWRTIPAGTYPWLKQDVPTIGLAALLVTTAAQSDPLVEAVATRLLDNIGRLGAAHPALARLGPRDLVGDEVGGRLRHPAATRVYRARKLVD